jgi:hypothetical protein
MVSTATRCVCEIAQEGSARGRRLCKVSIATPNPQLTIAAPVHACVSVCVSCQVSVLHGSPRFKRRLTEGRRLRWAGACLGQRDAGGTLWLAGSMHANAR